ncbi:hypothetical protein LTR95_010176 [Oleoguttula sp. CCFEE 5521]
MFGRFSNKSSTAPITPSVVPANDETTSGAQDDAPANEPIENWEMVGDDWGIIPDSAEVREELREEEMLARSTATLVDDTDDTNQGADAPAPANVPNISGPSGPDTKQPNTATLAGQTSAPPTTESHNSPSLLAVSNPSSVRNADGDPKSDAFAGVHYGDRHEYTDWNTRPQTSLSTPTHALGHGSATRLGLGPRTPEPMGVIERIIAQNGGRWPTEPDLSPPNQGQSATTTEPAPPTPLPCCVPSRSGAASPALASKDPIVPPATQSEFPEDYVPIDLHDADPRVYNETLETQIRLLQTDNASQRQVIETLRREVESARRAGWNRRTYFGGIASQALSQGSAPSASSISVASTAEARPEATQPAAPVTRSTRTEHTAKDVSIPPVPTMTFNDEDVDLTQHLDSVRRQIQALERHMQLGQNTLLNQVGSLLPRIHRLEVRLRWREDTEVGKLVARKEREEEDAERTTAGMWFEGTGLWTRPATHDVPRPPAQRVAIRTPMDARPRTATSSSASSGCPSPISSKHSRNAYSHDNNFVELTQPRTYPLDPRIVFSGSGPANTGGRQTLIMDYFRPEEAVSLRSRAAPWFDTELSPIGFEDLYAPASPRSHAASLKSPREDVTEYTELYQAASPRTGDPVREGRWPLNAMASSFHPDAAEPNIRSRAGLQPTQLQADSAPLHLETLPATARVDQPQLCSLGESMVGMAEAAQAASVPDMYHDGREWERPDTPRPLPAIDTDEPSPLSLSTTAAHFEQRAPAPQSTPVPVLNPRKQSIPASVRTASFSQRMPIIPSDTQERRQRRKRRKNAAALAR